VLNSVDLAKKEAMPADKVPVQPPTPLAIPRRIVGFVMDDGSAAALQSGLAGLDQAVEIKRGTIHHAVRFLEKDTNLQSIVVDIGDSDDPIVALEDLSRVCPPDVTVTVIGESTDIAFYRALINGMGVAEYLPKPITRDSVQTLLRPHLVGDEAERSTERGGHVVVICGAQGGAGATSIAANLALLLAETAKANVALLDLHLQDGEAAVMFGVRPGPGLRIALEDPLRADTLFLERTAIEVDPRVKLIAAAESLDEEMEITEAGVRHVLTLLRQKFNFIIVDLPVPVRPAMRPVIAQARHVLVLLEAEVTGLRNAVGLRELISKIAGANRMFTVLNRAERPGGLSRAMITKGLGGPPDIVIPDLGKRMTEAVNMGIPAVRRIPALRQHLAPVVREISGIRTGQSRPWFLRLFGR
jgi:pilus assembly protein CpaE